MKKVVIAILAIVALWWLVQIPSVINAIMLFCALGVNPFSGREITPASMAELLGVVLFISILLLFRKEIRRSVRAIRQRQPTPELEVATASTASQQPAPLQAVTFDATIGATVPQAVMQPLPPLPETRALTSMRHASTRRKRKSHNRNLRLRARRWWLHVGEPTLFAKLGMVRRTVIALCKQVAYSCQSAWRAFEPYARRFDRWLERKAHAHETTAALIALGREMENSLRAWLRTAQSLRQNEAVHDLLRSWRR